MTARSVSDLAADVEGYLQKQTCSQEHHDALGSHRELVSRLEAAEAELREADRLVETAWRQRDDETEKAKTAEAQVAALTQQRDDQIRITQNVYGLLVDAKRERNAAEAALAEEREAEREAHAAELGWDGATTAKERAENALAEHLEEIKQLVRSRDMYVRQRDEARTSLADTRRALERIRDNATSWHGPLQDTGHERALAVIAEWCDRALAAADGGTDPSASPFEQPATEDREGGLFGVKTYPGEAAAGGTEPIHADGGQRALHDACTLHVGCTAEAHMQECPAGTGQEQQP